MKGIKCKSEKNGKAALLRVSWRGVLMTFMNGRKCSIR